MIPLVLLAATEAEKLALGGGLFAAIVGFIGLFVAIVWIIFPFLVNSKFNELIRHQNATNLWLKKLVEGRGTEAPPTLQKPAGDTPAATPEKGPPALAPPLPKTEPEVYRI